MLSRNLYISLFYLRRHRALAVIGFIAFLGLTGFALYRIVNSEPALASTSESDMQATSDPITQEAPTQVPGRIYQDGPLPEAYSTCVEYQVINQWEDGFIADVTVINNTNQALEDWTVSWNFPDDQIIENTWNAQLENSEATASMQLKNVPWNVQIPVDSSVTFGFQGRYQGQNTPPTEFQLNGQSCSDLEKSALRKTVPPQEITTGPLQKLASCSVAYVVQSERLDDYSLDVEVVADAADPITDWRIQMKLGEDQTLVSLWDGNAWQEGQTITVLPVAFNKQLQGTDPLTFGLTVTGTDMPTEVTMNGTLCTVEQRVEEVLDVLQ